jgi:hypothetical protein
MFHKGPVAANGSCQKWHILFLDIFQRKNIRVISFKGLLSQWVGVIMCLPSQLCQISIDSVSVSGKLTHDSLLKFAQVTYFVVLGDIYSQLF